MLWRSDTAVEDMDIGFGGMNGIPERPPLLFSMLLQCGLSAIDRRRGGGYLERLREDQGRFRRLIGCRVRRVMACRAKRAVAVTAPARCPSSSFLSSHPKSLKLHAPWMSLGLASFVRAPWPAPLASSRPALSQRRRKSERICDLTRAIFFHIECRP